MQRRTSIYSQHSDEVIEYGPDGKILRRIRPDGTIIGPDGKILVWGTKERMRGRGGPDGVGERRTSIYSQHSDEVIEYGPDGKILRRTRPDGTVIGPDGKILVYGT